MRPETLARRVAEMDESISRLYKMWASVEVSLRVLEARLVALATHPGVEASRLASPSPVPAGTKDSEAGGR